MWETSTMLVKGNECMKWQRPHFNNRLHQLWPSYPFPEQKKGFEKVWSLLVVAFYFSWLQSKLCLPFLGCHRERNIMPGGGLWVENGITRIFFFILEAPAFSWLSFLSRQTVGDVATVPALPTVPFICVWIFFSNTLQVTLWLKNGDRTREGTPPPHPQAHPLASRCLALKLA